MRFMFDRLHAARVVVEPDVNNTKIHALDLSMGFVYTGLARFREKDGKSCLLPRAQFEQAQRQGVDAMSRTTPPHPAEIVAHLQPEIWNKVNRLLVRRAISEYAHGGCSNLSDSVRAKRRDLNAFA